MTNYPSLTAKLSYYCSYRNWKMWPPRSVLVLLLCDIRQSLNWLSTVKDFHLTPCANQGSWPMSLQLLCICFMSNPKSAWPVSILKKLMGPEPVTFSTRDLTNMVLWSSCEGQKKGTQIWANGRLHAILVFFSVRGLRFCIILIGPEGSLISVP